MSWFQRLFKRAQGISLLDPAFGELTFDRGTWTHTPSSPGESFMITIDAAELGPSSIQRAFFEDLQGKLPLLQETAKDYIKRVAEHAPNAERLHIYSIEIGSDEETKRRKFVLELTDHEEDTIHRVTFEAEGPINHTFDH